MFDLENLDKTEHYKIPDNYFDELPGRVMQNIKHEQQRRKTIITSAVAAVAALAIAVGVFFTFNTPDQGSAITQVQPATASVTEDEQEALETVAADYYSEELAMMDYYFYAY